MGCTKKSLEGNEKEETVLLHDVPKGPAPAKLSPHTFNLLTEAIVSHISASTKKETETRELIC